MTKEFTDAEFEATDSFHSFTHETDDEAMLMMKNIAFAIDHSHENHSVLITQRFIKSVLNSDGFTEEVPHQSSIVIPEDQLQGLIIQLIANGMCLTVDPEESNHHEG